MAHLTTEMAKLAVDSVGRFRRKAARKNVRSSQGGKSACPLRSLDVQQDGHAVTYQMITESDVLLGTVWGYRDNQWIELGTVHETTGTKGLGEKRTYAFSLNLDDVAGKVEPWTTQFQAIASTPAEDDDELESGYRFKLFVDVATVGTKSPKFAKETVVHGAEVEYRYPIGRAVETHVADFSEVRVGADSLEPYINSKGLQSVAVNTTLPPFGRVRNDSLTLDDGVLHHSGRLYTRNSQPESARFVLVGRTTGYHQELTLALDPMADATAAKYGLRRYRYSVDFDFSENIDDITNDIVDLYIDIDVKGQAEPHRVRVGRSRYMVRQEVASSSVTNDRIGVQLSPYYTFKAKNPSIRMEIFGRREFDYLQRRISGESDPDVPTASDKPIWLVGEMSYKAQDNGLQMFKYLRDEHPEVDAYYVLDADSNDRRNLVGYDHVIDFRSIEHIRVTLAAEKVLGTHNPEFIYPTVAKEFQKKVKALKVFLQHGVTAAKWMVPNYGKAAAGFSTDLITVCSEREKQFYVQDFGYDPSEVAVTGFARFDALFAGDVEKKTRQVMIMPTWRPWLQDPERFRESEYFTRWSEVLQSPRMQELVKKHDLSIVFCLHPNMQQYSGDFLVPGVRVVNQGEVDVQFLMKESGVMITDYSSVAFDFSFLHKPVAYYQFDADRFAPPHADPATELPGPIVTSCDEVLSFIDHTYEDAGEMRLEYIDRADRFIAHRDTHSRERIFEAVDSAKLENDTLKDFYYSEFVQTVIRRGRKDKRYLPTMKKLYRLWRRLPLDPNIIVFESGQGKQFGDSPRAIYEELVRRGDPRKKVWIYSGRIPNLDPNTVVVKRHSPGFFWYLARAKYWVNNHNFPAYIHRRKGGVYVQTWHGTPLKRMFLDQENFFGRDPGYIGRVKESSAQWNQLVSPSAYATAAMRSSYGYTGPVMEEGYPRNDILARRDRDQIGVSVRRKLGIGLDKKVVLYAPTFRDDRPTSKGHFAFDWPFDAHEFVDALGEDTVLLVRTHVLVNTKLPVPDELRSNVKDVSEYPNIEELFLASDMLVTDYSSSFFDYSILQRPIVFFAFDLENYRDNLRGFYLDYDKELPGPIVRTSTELFQVLAEFRDGKREYKDILRKFAERFAPNEDGHAAGRVIDRLLS